MKFLPMWLIMKKLLQPRILNRYVHAIRNENPDKVFNIKSSKIDIHIEPGTGLAVGEASLRGIVNLSKRIRRTVYIHPD